MQTRVIDRGQQTADSADFLEAKDREQHRDRHQDHRLDEIGSQNGPSAAQRGVKQHDKSKHDDRGVDIQPEENRREDREPIKLHAPKDRSHEHAKVRNELFHGGAKSKPHHVGPRHTPELTKPRSGDRGERHKHEHV